MPQSIPVLEDLRRDGIAGAALHPRPPDDTLYRFTPEYTETLVLALWARIAELEARVAVLEARP